LPDDFESILPASWDLGDSHRNSSLNLSLSHDNYDYTSFIVRNSSAASKLTVLANRPIPTSQLKKLAINRQVSKDPFANLHSNLHSGPQTTRSAGTRDLSNLISGGSATPPKAAGRAASTPLYPKVMASTRGFPGLDDQQDALLGDLVKDSLYYFETTVNTLPSGCVACIGLVIDRAGTSASDGMPGESRDSIGLDSNGILRAGGRLVDSETWHPEGKTGIPVDGFGEGDVIGCAVEISGLRRILFTKNGKIIVPLTRFHDVEMRKNPHSPAFGIKIGRNKTISVMGNFGLERRPFQWGQPDFLVFKPTVEESASYNSHQKSPRGPAPFPGRMKPKKPPNRQQSAPSSSERGTSSSPRSPRTTRKGLVRNSTDSDRRQATSLSPAIGLYGRRTNNRLVGEPPTIRTGQHAQDDSDHAQSNVYGAPSSLGLMNDLGTNDLTTKRPPPSSGTGDRLHASMSHLESEWQTQGQHGYDDGSGFLSASSGRQGSNAPSSLEFTCINEHDEGGADSFLAGAPETNQNVSQSGYYDEEEKTAIDDPDQGLNASSAGPITPKEIEGMKENIRMLRSVCGDDTAVDASVLESLLDCCKADQQTVKIGLEKAMTNEDQSVDLMELIGLNELVLDAVKLGEDTIEATKKKAAEQQPQPTPQKSNPNMDLDINGLIRKKDVFSLICILRAQSDQRLDAALALMEFARDGERPEDGGISLRDEIRSSGGMHSLLQVFRAKGTSYELRVVAGMAVAYVLPSFVESSPGVGLKVMECLRFLSTSRPVSPNGVKISREMMFKASAMGVTAFWMNALEPMLNSGMSVNDGGAERSDLHITSNNGAGLAASGIFDQGQQTLELQELLEMTVSLIVHIEKNCESDAVNGSGAHSSEALSMWRYTNVEQVCTVDVARPIAVREGLLPILVDWIKSKDKEKIRPAVSALRYLTSIKDKYMAGWIHSQMVNEGALSEVVKLADDYNAGHDVRLAVAQILSSLCVAPHTRAAVVEAKCMYYLIGFLYDHSDQASEEVALFAGRAITQLAAGAITRASVFGGGDTEILDFVSPDKRDSLVE
jgi:hypothetical protein